MRQQISTNLSDSQNVYIGLDVHLAQWNVCIIHNGLKSKSFQQPPSATCLYEHLQRHYPGKKYYSAYEAGFCGSSIHYDLMELGIENIIFNAADVSQTHKEKMRKTDSIDATKIARSLWHNELHCIHIPPQWRLEDRNLLRLRSNQCSDIKRMKSRLRHFLHTNGISIPQKYSQRWSIEFFNWILCQGASMANSTGETLTLMCRSLLGQVAEHKALNRRLVLLMNTPRYATDYELLRTIPGVGSVTAISLLLECGDLADFYSAETFCSFVGLVPDIHQSGSRNPDCSMTRRRHKALRYMLIECAWRAIAKDEHLARLYHGYARRMPTQKAIVKIANKLAKIIKFVLKNKKEYDPPK